MKYHRILILCALSTFGVSCATDTPPSQHASNDDYADGDPREIPPRIGMTEAQVLKQYGEPKSRAVTETGETWVYLLNFGEMIGKAFIPFHGVMMPRTGMIIFGADGKVKSYQWQAHTND